MQAETYTPGYSRVAVEYMLQRSIESHGQFFCPYLVPGVSVLDCGCGPGSITLGIGALVAPGRVVGIDAELSQAREASTAAIQGNAANVKFCAAGVYSLPFTDAGFDRVFSHALFEHLADPLRALRELFRVLTPGGIIGVCTPDWGGRIVSPPSEPMEQAIRTVNRVQTQNGGDVQVGRKLSRYLSAAGFVGVQPSARYECYPSADIFGELLASVLERAGEDGAAKTVREWNEAEGGMFAMAWVSCVGRKPDQA
ncbi:hypothetical protein YTPLAS18_09530 [Nitrospira sp.]|nr:hypothetical protein YTPLAS18_09530 [Nitrospira sp.]